MAKPPLTPKLQLALDACHATIPLFMGEICFRSIPASLKKKGVSYRDLAKLARLGYLQRTDEGRYAVYCGIVGAKNKRVLKRNTRKAKRLHAGFFCQFFSCDGKRRRYYR